jgi:hypothetical protein
LTFARRLLFFLLPIWCACGGGGGGGTPPTAPTTRTFAPPTPLGSRPIGPPPPILPRSDFNRDGSSDLVLRDDRTGNHEVWFLERYARTGAQPFSPARPVDGNWRLVGVNDFGGDDGPDVLWRNDDSGQLALWILGGVVRQTGFVIQGLPDLRWTVAGTGDFDDDNQADILWRNTLTGELMVWFMNGAVHEADARLDYPDLPPPAWGLTAGDLSGDDKPELLWQDPATGRLSVWTLKNAQREQVIALGQVEAPWKVVAICDLDRDGWDDLVWRHDETGWLVYWPMQGMGAVTWGRFTPEQVPTLDWKVVGPR